MNITIMGVKVGELTSDGLIRDIQDPRLLAIAQDVLVNGVEMVSYVFLEDHKSEATTHIVEHENDEYPMALWGHLHKLGYEVESLPGESVELEKAEKFVGMAHKLSVGLPYGAKKYGPILEQQIRNTLLYAVHKGVAKWREGMTKAEMHSVFSKMMDKWLDDLLVMLKPMVWNLMQTGLASSGGVLVEDQLSNAHKLAMTYLEDNPNSILNAVKTLNVEQKQEAIGVLDDAFAGKMPWDLKKIKGAMMERADVSATHAELIARTEMTKISNQGRIFAWEQDPMRDDYNYHYIPTRDSRTKDVSLELAQNGPYSFDEIRALWLNPVSPTTGQSDVFNNRCGVARTRKRDIG